MYSITATDLPRFMSCPGSYFLEKLPKFQDTEVENKEGDAAHWLVQQACLNQFSVDELVDRKAPNGVYITSEMVDHCRDYINDFKGEIEYDTSLKNNTYEIRGRADRVSFVDRILEVEDFKYGWGLVEPDENLTLISHAIGYAYNLMMNKGMNPRTDIDRVVLKIYQPRPYHPLGKVREWSITAEQLNEYHKKINEAFENITNTLNTSTYCKYCPSVGVCSAHNSASMNAIDLSEKPFDFNIADEDLPIMLDNLTRAKKTLETSLKAFEDLAANRIKQGHAIPGYALERSLANRTWLDHVTPELLTVVTAMDGLTEVKLVSPAQAVKKGLDEALVNTLSERKETGMKLCKVDPTKKVEKMFGEFFKTQKGN